MRIKNKTLLIRLENNPTAKAFFEKLPFTMMREELNGKEKFGDFCKTLPVISSSPGTIHRGDIMLYGHKTVMLFYDTFKTSYRYSPTGKVVDTEGLNRIVGKKMSTSVFS